MGFKYAQFANDDSKTQPLPEFRPFFGNYLGELQASKGPL
jgi:hypothetical protein